MTTPQLTLATFKMSIRNKQSLFFSLFLPLVFIGVFSLVGFDKTPSIAVGVVTDQPTAATQQFVDGLRQVSVLKITTGTEAEERAALQKGDRVLVMILPNDLIPSTPRTTPEKVVALKNVAQDQQAATALTVVQQILDHTSLAMARATDVATLDVQNINVRKVKYLDFLLPGIVAMSIMQVSVFAVAFVFADYKEKGILKRLLATPMQPAQFVAANVITRLVMTILQAGLLLGLGALVFKTHVYGSLWLVLLIAVLAAVIFLALGFVISAVAKNVDSVPAIANLIVFPMIFLSGTFFPVTSMPSLVQHIVKYLPLTPFTNSLRSVVADGVGFTAVRGDILLMLGWAVVLVALAMFTFRFEERRI